MGVNEARFEVDCLDDVGSRAETLPDTRPDVTVLNGEYTDEERRRWIDRLHARWPGSRVIDVHRMQVWSASSARADATLTKPFHADTLVEAINELVGHDGHAGG